MDNRPKPNSTLERSTLLLAALIPLGALLLGGFSFVEQNVFRPKGQDAARGVLLINGDRDADLVVFDHARHQKDQGGKDGCARCHHLRLPRDFNVPCFQCHSRMESPALFFGHAAHQEKLGANESCEKCHEPLAPKSREFTRDCNECHADDIGLQANSPAVTAPPYVDAMHGMCENCHRESAKTAGRENLASCDTCHREVTHRPEERQR